MASFPGAKVHRPSRRKLGRGQHTQLPSATVAATTATPDVTLTFSVPVIVSGTPNFTVTGLTILSWTQPTPTTVHLVMSGATTGLTYSYPANDPNVSTFQGGAEAGTSGTF